jgi:polysaccharide biosynthesis protein PslG
LCARSQWAQENWQPWIALMTVIYMPDVAWTKDTEQYYWSSSGPGYPDLFLRAAYVELCIYINKLEGQRCAYDPNPQSRPPHGQ